jgi:hypothetical protein
MIPMGLFEEWGSLWDWSEKNEKYVRVSGNPEMMDGLYRRTHTVKMVTN